MSKLNSVFINEYNNPISMSIEVHSKGITVWVTSPTSEVEHTWTKSEAIWLSWLLAAALNATDQELKIN